MRLEHPNEELLTYLDVFKRKVEAERNKRLLQKNKKFRTDWYKFLQDDDSDQETGVNQIVENKNETSGIDLFANWIACEFYSFCELDAHT